MLNIVDVEIILSGLLVCVSGEVVEAIADQRLNLLEAQRNSPFSGLFFWLHDGHFSKPWALSASFIQTCW
jgi:hypothetical protein